MGKVEKRGASTLFGLFVGVGVLSCLLASGGTASAQGPDVIVGSLDTPDSYGNGGSGSIYAYAVGTTSCNIGTQNLLWHAGTNEHPVIGQDMFKLKDGRLTQIGAGWLKHGFFALSGTLCGSCPNPTDGSTLGVGCSDPYGAGLNGSQGGLGPRSQVNASTGFFPYPFSAPGWSGTIARRLQVHVNDLDHTLNPPATTKWFVSGHYVTQDDAAAGNQDNNVSYRRVNVGASGNRSLSFVGGFPTQQQQPPIQAWQDFQPSVQLDDVQANDGLFIVGSDVIDNGNGTYRYEYAVYNMNSDRSAQSFFVPVPAGVTLSDIGFHDITWHSGEPYSGTDWTVTQTTGVGITWAGQTHAQNVNANAIRWSMLFNFWFTCDAPPTSNTGTIGLFKPGTPTSMSCSIKAPSGNFLPAVQNLACAQTSPTGSAVGLSWTNPIAYDSIAVRRDGAVIANLAGSATGYADVTSFGAHTYTVQATDNAIPSAEIPCVIDLLPAPVSAVTCQQPNPAVPSATVSWVNGMAYDSVRVYRQGTLVATLAGSATSHTLTSLAYGLHTLEIAGVVGGVESADVDCLVDVLPPPPLAFTFRLLDATGSYDVASGVGSVDVSVTASESPANIGYPNPVSAFSMGVSYDPAMLEVSGLQPGAGLSSPEFFNGQLLADSVTIGAVMDFEGQIVLELSSETEVAQISFETNATNAAGDADGRATSLEFENGLGTGLPIDNIIVVDFDDLVPALDGGLVTLMPVAGGVFRRGDANSDGQFNIADAVSILAYLFQGGAATCLDALDTNDDGSVNIADGVTELSYLFSSGPAPAAPFPGCGVDPTADSVQCASYPAVCP